MLFSNNSKSRQVHGYLPCKCSEVKAGAEVKAPIMIISKYMQWVKVTSQDAYMDNLQVFIMSNYNNKRPHSDKDTSTYNETIRPNTNTYPKP